MLARGRAVREALKQPQYEPLSATEQVVILVAATQGLFDGVPSDVVAEASNEVRRVLPERLPRLQESIESGKKLSNAERGEIAKVFAEVIGALWHPPSH
jgi:F-type H+-transporting ATPase subunit alpha